jgi:hypothetical protein
MTGRPVTVRDVMLLHRMLADWHRRNDYAVEEARAYHQDFARRLNYEAKRIEDELDLDAPG